MIAKRGVSLLRAMLASERNTVNPQNRRIDTSQSQRMLHKGLMNTRSNELSIPAIIRAFSQQYQELATSEERHDRWSDLMSSETEMLAPLGVDCAEGFDNILNLASSFMA